MLSDLGINQFAPVRLQPRKCPFLVGTHEPAVTRDIRGENGGQLAFDAFCGQSGLLPRGPNGSSALGPILTVNAGCAITLSMRRTSRRSGVPLNSPHSGFALWLTS